MSAFTNLPFSLPPDSILEALGELVFILDKDGGYRYIYAADQAALIRPADELLNSKVPDVFPPATASAIMTSLAETLSSRKPVRIDYTIEIGGKVKWFEGRLAPVADDRVLFVAFDITARRETEKRLINSQANLAYILDNTEQAFFLIHKDSRLIVMNHPAGELLQRFKIGVRKPGEKMIDILPRNLSVEIAVAFRNAIAGKNSHISKEYLFEGEMYHFNFEIAPICGPDQEPNIIAIGVKDSTESWSAEQKLRDSEARFRFLADNIDDVIWQLSPEGVVLYVSHGLEKMLGISPENVTGKSVFSILSPSSGAAVFNVLTELSYSDEVPGNTFDLQFRHINGSFRWGEVRFTAPVNHRGKISYIMGILRDVTIRHETEAKLKETSARLLELNRTKDKFFSLIAHDLKNPMNAIRGYSELLTEDCDDLSDEEIRQYSSAISNSVGELNKLLDDLLVWSRTQMGTINFSPEIMNLSILVNEAIIYSQLSAGKKDCLLLNAVPASVEIFADVNMIRTVLRNLLSNAVKFSYRGSRVTVLSTSDGEFVSITVADEGIGMSEQIKEGIEHVGNPVHTTGTEGEAGSGFGLLISKEFVGYHKGTLSISPNEPRGTRVSFALPVSESVFKRDF